MKKTKIALTLVCAILIVAASVMGTLAYLTATTGTVTNTFTIGNVGFDDPSLGDDLDEAAVDEYGVKKTDAEGKDVARVNTNIYKLVPGHTYVKDPIVHMSSTTEDAYLFVTVSNGISDIETTESGKTIAAQMAAKGWKEVKDGSGNLVAYVYCGPSAATATSTRAKVTKNQDIVVFDTFTLADDAKVEETISVAGGQGGTKTVNKYADGLAKITIKAYAIQADGIASTVTDYELWQNFNA